MNHNEKCAQAAWHYFVACRSKQQLDLWWEMCERLLEEEMRTCR